MADYYWPTDNTSTSRGYGNGHDGTDILPLTEGKEGDPVYAFMAGTVGAVLTPDGNPNEGYSIRLHHATDPLGNGECIRTQYMHFSKKPTLAVGAKVTAGQTIGCMGSTGNSTGVHLHFEVKYGSSSDFPQGGPSRWDVGEYANSDDYLALV